MNLFCKVVGDLMSRIEPKTRVRSRHRARARADAIVPAWSGGTEPGRLQPQS